VSREGEREGDELPDFFRKFREEEKFALRTGTGCGGIVRVVQRERKTGGRFFEKGGEINLRFSTRNRRKTVFSLVVVDQGKKKKHFLVSTGNLLKRAQWVTNFRSGEKGLLKEQKTTEEGDCDTTNILGEKGGKKKYSDAKGSPIPWRLSTGIRALHSRVDGTSS